MFMYHGTSSVKLRSILEEGILPRGEDKGNWDHNTMLSREDAVYLTTAYPIHFAENASQELSTDLLIVEVDFSQIPTMFVGPDEDFLEQVTRDDPKYFWIPGESTEERTKYFASCDWHVWSDYWEASIKGLGNCCIRHRVPLSAITRYALLPRGHDLIKMSDPTISVMNYHLCGAFYRNLTKYVFGDTDFEPDLALDSSALLNIPRKGIRVIEREGL